MSPTGFAAVPTTPLMLPPLVKFNFKGSPPVELIAPIRLTRILHEVRFKVRN
ncbi:hypothetical protein [Rickettsia endosymbiont of Polydrusus tereticollis]|uniref:hypothetical protein n=1 Tax=Rickettsia endosymbiont of Polydrusus tereticollis TaxID=3066251 RepID=UPI0031330F59